MQSPSWPAPLLEELVTRLEAAGPSGPALRLREDPVVLPGLGERLRSLVRATRGLLRVEEAEEAGPPGILVRHPALGEAAVWSAVPEGPEAGPFLEFLVDLSGTPPGGGGSARTGGPALQVLIAPGCPNCPRAVAAAGRLVVDGAASRLRVVDVTAFPGEAERLGVASVPVTVVDGLVLTGVRPADELGELLAVHGTPVWPERVLAAHLEEGRVEAAAGLITGGEGVEAFAALWSRSSLTSRLGLLLAARTVLEHEPGALDGAVEPLVRVLESEDPALRGDTADLLGDVGHPAARPALERVAGDADPEVAEAAREALDRLREP